MKKQGITDGSSPPKPTPRPPPPSTKPPPAGSGTIAKGSLYLASDNSPLTVTFTPDGSVASAEGKGKDGVLRRYSRDASGVQHYSQSGLPDLTVTLSINKLAQSYTITNEAGTIRTVQLVDCKSAAAVETASSATFLLTNTRFDGGAQTRSDTVQISLEALQQRVTTNFIEAFGANYQNLVLFFAPLLEAVAKSKPPATPEDKSAWASIGRGIVWGLAGLVGGAITVGTGGTGLGILFLAGFDASVVSDIISSWEQRNSSPPPPPPPGGPDAGVPVSEGDGGSDGGAIAEGGEDGGGGDGGGCFAAGTLVTTGNGLRAIESIETDDLVVSQDEDTEVTSLQRVLRTWVHEAHPTVLLSLATGEVIQTTAKHRFFVCGRGFVAVSDLEAGDCIRTRRNTDVRISQIEAGTGARTVYNLSVANTQTYFVGETQAWVHNVKVEGGPDERGEESAAAVVRPTASGVAASKTTEPPPNPRKANSTKPSS